MTNVVLQLSVQNQRFFGISTKLICHTLQNKNRCIRLRLCRKYQAIFLNQIEIFSGRLLTDKILQEPVSSPKFSTV